jgi:LEA14-like dessication related protein
MWKGSVALVGASLLLAGCSKPEPPTLTPRSARIVAISPTSVTLALELDVRNPNPFPLVFREVSGSLELGNGVELGRGRSVTNGSVPAKGSSVIPAELSVNWTNIAVLAPLAASPDPVPYSLRGVATIGGEKLNVDLPFVVKGVLTREQVLQAGLRGLGSVPLPLP